MIDGGKSPKLHSLARGAALNELPLPRCLRRLGERAHGLAEIAFRLHPPCIVMRLEDKPVQRACARQPGQSQSHIRGDPPALVEEAGDRLARNTQLLRQLLLRDAEMGEDVLTEDLARVGWPQKYELLSLLFLESTIFHRIISFSCFSLSI